MLHRLRITSQDHQTGDRRFGSRDTWRHLAAHAMAEDVDARGVHGWLALEQVDGGDRVRHILVRHREGGCVRHLMAVGIGYLVEADNRYAATGQSPCEVFERLVWPAGLVAVEWASSAEQHNTCSWAASMREA